MLAKSHHFLLSFLSTVHCLFLCLFKSFVCILIFCYDLWWIKMFRTINPPRTIHHTPFTLHLVSFFHFSFIFFFYYPHLCSEKTPTFVFLHNSLKKVTNLDENFRENSQWNADSNSIKIMYIFHKLSVLAAM